VFTSSNIAIVTITRAITLIMHRQIWLAHWIINKDIIVISTSRDLTKMLRYQNVDINMANGMLTNSFCF